MSWRVLVVVAVVVIGGHAFADDVVTNPDAKAHLDSANAHYKAGDYDAAISELRAAYAIEPQPALLYAWAQAERKRGRCDEAVPLYRRYLKQDVTEEQRRAAQANIDKCAAEDPKLAPNQEPAPVASTVIVTPPVQVAEPTPWYRDRVGNMLAGSGVVLAGAGGVFFALSLHEKSKSDDATNVGAYGDAREAARRDRMISIGCFAAGAALVTVGIVYYRHHGRSRSVDVSAFVEGDGGGLALATDF